MFPQTLAAVVAKAAPQRTQLARGPKRTAGVPDQASKAVGLNTLSNAVTLWTSKRSVTTWRRNIASVSEFADKVVGVLMDQSSSRNVMRGRSFQRLPDRTSPLCRGSARLVRRHGSTPVLAYGANNGRRLRRISKDPCVRRLSPSRPTSARHIDKLRLPSKIGTCSDAESRC